MELLILIQWANKYVSICPFCNSTETEMIWDIGFDIDPSGEEKQHLQVCKKCFAERLYFERWDWETDINFKDFFSTCWIKR